MSDRRGRGVVLGIDPGLDGALARIGPDGVEASVTPTIAAGRGGRRGYDAGGMLALLEARPVDLAVIEAVGPRPGQGVVSMFSFGRGLGLWEGLLGGLRVPYQLVLPRAWKQSILAGTARDKAAAIAFAARRFPSVPLRATPRCRVPHEGISEALCIAEYARRLLLGPGAGA